MKRDKNNQPSTSNLLQKVALAYDSIKMDPAKTTDMQKEIWVKRYRHWEDETRPARPTSDEVGIYERLFLDHKTAKKNILLLGVTPELRDMFSRHNISPIIVDFSSESFMLTSRFLKNALPANETWITNNWLHLPYPEHYFDFIFGDIVLNQFPPTLEVQFLKEVHRTLGQSGHFITRTTYIDSSFGPSLLQEKVRAICRVRRLTQDQKIAMVVNAALFTSRDTHTRRMSPTFARMLLSKIREKIDKKSDDLHDELQNKVIHNAISQLQTTPYPGGRWWAPPSQEHLCGLFTKEFSIGKVLHAKDHPSRYLPIFDLVPQ